MSNTVKAVAKTEPEPRVPPVAYIEAFACDEWGDSPAFVAIQVTDELKAQLRALTALLYANDLSLIAPQGGPNASWGPEAAEDNLRMEWPDLRIMRSFDGKADFFFRAHPKHADYACETRTQEVEEFIAAVERGERYFGDDPEYLKEQAELEPNEAPTA